MDQINTDIEVLREMVRLAENRRAETRDSLERIIKYNLALIAFSASFLSLLVTASFDIFIVQTAGLLLLISILLSLFAVRPKVLQTSIIIDQDIELIKKNVHLDLKEYVLCVAELTEAAATNLNNRAAERKRYTIASAVSLALALLITYTLYAYATPW
jgi:hypothetical protein